MRIKITKDRIFLLPIANRSHLRIVKFNRDSCKFHLPVGVRNLYNLLTRFADSLNSEIRAMRAAVKERYVRAIGIPVRRTTRHDHGPR